MTPKPKKLRKGRVFWIGLCRNTPDCHAFGPIHSDGPMVEVNGHFTGANGYAAWATDHIELTPGEQIKVQLVEVRGNK